MKHTAEHTTVVREPHSGPIAGDPWPRENEAAPKSYVNNAAAQKKPIRFNKCPEPVKAVQFNGENMMVIFLLPAAHSVKMDSDGVCLQIKTAHGTKTARVGDYVAVHEGTDRLFVCDPEEFAKTYNLVDAAY